MTAPLQSAALICTALGLLCGAVVLLRTRSVPVALPVLLDFLLAAGLLRLSAAPDYRALTVAAVVIGIRRLVTGGLTGGVPASLLRRARRLGAAGPESVSAQDNSSSSSSASTTRGAR